MDGATPPEVLVVDHAANFREMLDIFLADEGYHVTDVSLEEASFEQILGHSAALAIVGLQPRAARDLELLEQMRRGSAALPVIVLTTSSQLLEQVRSRPERYAGDRFLRLPLDLDDLLEAVHALVPPSSGAPDT